MGAHFFAEEMTWSLYLNAAHAGHAVALSRDRRPIAQIRAPEWATLEKMICLSAERGNLDSLAQIIVGNLLGTTLDVPAQVRERLKKLLAKHLQETIAPAAA
jgi:hypothetical protein